MTTLTAQIPDSLARKDSELAARESVPVDPLVALALSSQVAGWETRNSLEERARPAVSNRCGRRWIACRHVRPSKATNSSASEAIARRRGAIPSARAESDRVRSGAGFFISGEGELHPLRLAGENAFHS